MMDILGGKTMDASLFVNHIDPAFFAGILVGVGVIELARLLKKYGKKQEEKKTNKSYDDTKKIFEQVF